MKYLFCFFIFIVTVTPQAFSIEVVSCTKDYTNSNTHVAYQLKELQIKFESYTPGTSSGALRAKGQIGYAGIRSEVKRILTVNSLTYKAVLQNDFLLVLKEIHHGTYSGVLTLRLGTAMEQEIKDLKCIMSGELPGPKVCEDIQAKSDHALFYSLLTSELDELRFALDCGANPNSTNKNGCTPLLHLLDSTCGQKANSLFSYAPYKQTQMASMLIDSGASLENTDPMKEQTALHKATLAGNADVVSILIDLEVNLDAQDINQETALMFAVWANNYFLVKDLVNANANINLKNKAGETAYQLAKSLKREAIAELLLPVKQQIKIEGNANMIGCSVSKIEIKSGEAVEIVLKASKKMILLKSTELGIRLMAMPNEEVKTRFTPNMAGTFEFICGPHGGPADQQTNGTIIVK